MVLFFALAHLSFGSESVFDASMDQKGGSGISGRPYTEIVGELDTLARIYPEYAEKIQYGVTEGGRPLTAIKISKKSVPQTLGSKAILIAGSIHGNEFLNIEDRLPRWFIEEGMKNAEIQKYFDEGNVIYVAPILNPDGYAIKTRTNLKKADLNRDFTVRRKNYFAFKQNETKALTEWLNDEIQVTGRKLAVTMDYHCCIGAVLRPWSFKTSKPPEPDMVKFDTVGRILREVFGKNYKYGTTPAILKYEAVGTSKDFYYETYGAIALTFEGKYKKEHQRFKEHTEMWQKMISAILKGTL